MIVADGQGDAPLARDRQIVAAIVDDDRPPRFPADLVIDLREDVETIAARLRLWLPPVLDGLDRMAAMFGRAALAPVVNGLRAELDEAAKGGWPDAHRLAGLSGTLGLAAAAESWRAVESGSGDQAAALRDSRTALIAIDRWLEQDREG